MGELILLRHGQTEWSQAGKHTGRTDIPMTADGEAAAAALAPALARRKFAAVFTSPAQRAIRTAELAGLTGGDRNAKQDPDLWEWDYGGYEGVTTEEIQRTRPGWYLWRDGVIPGDEALRPSPERARRCFRRMGCPLRRSRCWLDITRQPRRSWFTGTRSCPR
jgi:probable phosphoglycerate mutase